MIKFFRQIRFKLLSNDLTGRYLKYAIGEIILVVIGILIALQINNWNEKRQQKETLRTVYKMIAADLKTDIGTIDNFIEEFKTVREPAVKQMLSDSITKAFVIENNVRYGHMIAGWEDFNINQRGLTLLQSQSVLPTTVNEDLATEIQEFYNVHIVEIQTASKELSTEFTDNLQNLRKQPWFLDFTINGNQDVLIDFMLNNQDARNRAALFFRFYQIYANELELFKKDAEQLINKITIYLNED